MPSVRTVTDTSRQKSDQAEKHDNKGQTLKENEWECEKCKRVNTYDLEIKNSYRCAKCNFTNKVIKDLIGQMNDIDLVNEQKQLMSPQPS